MIARDKDPAPQILDRLDPVAFGSNLKLINCSNIVIRKFFLNHNKSFEWHLGDYEKHIFFPFEGL